MQEVERAETSEDEGTVAGLLARYEARRHSLPVFMRELKQRFTRWFNRRHSRKGTLWEERYRSVLVEGDASALTAVVPTTTSIDCLANLCGFASRHPNRWRGEAVSPRRDR